MLFVVGSWATVIHPHRVVKRTEFFFDARKGVMECERWFTLSGVEGQYALKK